jgi:RNA polymerase sigma factor (sigma-70 family)
MSGRPGPGPDFVFWFRGSANQILRWAYFYTKDPKLAEDIAQEAAVKVFKAWADDEKRNMILTSPGYVRTIVKHCFADHRKVLSRTSEREVELDVERHAGAGDEIDHSIRMAILELEDAERDMILLVYYSGLTIREAGNQLGLSPARAYRLHEKARENLAGLMDEGEA